MSHLTCTYVDVLADVTGRLAAEELVKDLSSGGCVDQYLQDQASLYSSH